MRLFFFVRKQTDGCVRFANRDSQTDRVLPYERTPPGGMTPEICSSGCNNAGFKLAGVENGGESCCTCFTGLFNELSSSDQTSLLKSVVMMSRVGRKP